MGFALILVVGVGGIAALWGSRREWDTFLHDVGIALLTGSVLAFAIFLAERDFQNDLFAQSERLENVRFVRAVVTEAGSGLRSFTGLDLQNSQLSRLGLGGADFARSDLRGANLSGTVLDRSILSEADLTGADLSQASFFEANLAGARLDGVVGQEADFTRANLSAASFADAELRGAVFARADLSATDFSGASTEQANFSDACYRDGTSPPQGLDLTIGLCAANEASQDAPAQGEPQSDPVLPEDDTSGGPPISEMTAISILARPVVLECEGGDPGTPANHAGTGDAEDVHPSPELAFDSLAETGSLPETNRFLKLQDPGGNIYFAIPVPGNDVFDEVLALVAIEGRSGVGFHVASWEVVGC